LEYKAAENQEADAEIESPDISEEALG